MYDLIKTKPVFFPDAKKHGIFMSENCKDFIKGCLMKDPKERLGTNGGLEEIISHPWFAGINVDDLLSKRLNPEFKPKLNSNIFDVSNFDKMFTSDEAMISVVPKDVQRKINMQ
jgi:serine/threonine protein kinase